MGRQGDGEMRRRMWSSEVFFSTQRLNATGGRNQRVGQALLPVQVCDGQECPSYRFRARMTEIKRLQ